MIHLGFHSQGALCAPRRVPACASWAFVCVLSHVFVYQEPPAHPSAWGWGGGWEDKRREERRWRWRIEYLHKEEQRRQSEGARKSEKKAEREEAKRNGKRRGSALCVHIYPSLHWLKGASADWWILSFKVFLRSEESKRGRRSVVFPRSSLFISFLSFLHAISTAVSSLSLFTLPYLTTHEAPVGPLACLMYHVELHTVAIRKPLADWG